MHEKRIEELYCSFAVRIHDNTIMSLQMSFGFRVVTQSYV